MRTTRRWCRRCAGRAWSEGRQLESSKQNHGQEAKEGNGKGQQRTRRNVPRVWQLSGTQARSSRVCVMATSLHHMTIVQVPDFTTQTTQHSTTQHLLQVKPSTPGNVNVARGAFPHTGRVVLGAMVWTAVALCSNLPALQLWDTCHWEQFLLSRVGFVKGRERITSTTFR